MIILNVELLNIVYQEKIEKNHYRLWIISIVLFSLEQRRFDVINTVESSEHHVDLRIL